MALYTVHIPEHARDALDRGERTVLVREGFSVRAFVFGSLYLLWHRLWAALAVWIVVGAAIAGFGLLLRVPPAGLLPLVGLMHLYLGLEGPDLRRWGLARQGLPMRDVVSASGRDAAEASLFTRSSSWPAAAPQRPQAAAWSAPVPASDVIGFFPEREGA